MSATHETFIGVSVPSLRRIIPALFIAIVLTVAAVALIAAPGGTIATEPTGLTPVQQVEADRLTGLAEYQGVHVFSAAERAEIARLKGLTEQYQLQNLMEFGPWDAMP